MSNPVKISQLPDATVPAGNSDTLPVVQNGVTKKISIFFLAGAIAAALGLGTAAYRSVGTATGNLVERGANNTVAATTLSGTTVTASSQAQLGTVTGNTGVRNAQSDLTGIGLAVQNSSGTQPTVALRNTLSAAGSAPSLQVMAPPSQAGPHFFIGHAGTVGSNTDPYSARLVWGTWSAGGPSGYQLVPPNTNTGPITLPRFMGEVVTQQALPTSSGLVLTSVQNNTPVWSAPAGGLPSQTGQAGKFLTTNGTAASWATASGGGGSTHPAVAWVNGTTFGNDSTGVVGDPSKPFATVGAALAAANPSGLGRTLMLTGGVHEWNPTGTGSYTFTVYGAGVGGCTLQVNGSLSFLDLTSDLTVAVNLASLSTPAGSTGAAGDSNGDLNGQTGGDAAHLSVTLRNCHVSQANLTAGAGGMGGDGAAPTNQGNGGNAGNGGNGGSAYLMLDHCWIKNNAGPVSVILGSGGSPGNAASGNDGDPGGNGNNGGEGTASVVLEDCTGEATLSVTGTATVSRSHVYSISASTAYLRNSHVATELNASSLSILFSTADTLNCGDLTWGGSSVVGKNVSGTEDDRGGNTDLN